MGTESPHEKSTAMVSNEGLAKNKPSGHHIFFWKDFLTPAEHKS